MKKTPLISFIIPVYNGEKYLERCIDSILKQGLSTDQYEIIAINDGSTDRSVEILENYYTKCNLIVHNQSNSGVASARNYGIENANGIYLTFIDADDYLIESGLSNLIASIGDINKYDVIKFSSVTVDRYYDEKNYTSDFKVLSSANGLDLIKDGRWGVFCWGQIIKVSFLRETKVRFKKLKITEDTLFCMDLYLQNPRVIESAATLYRYCVNENSAVTKRDDKALLKAIESYSQFLSYTTQMAKDYPDSALSIREMQRRQLTPYLSRLLNSNISLKQFRSFMADVKRQGITDNAQDISKKDKLISFVIDHPSFFILLKPIYRCLFVPFILPRLKRN